MGAREFPLLRKNNSGDEGKGTLVRGPVVSFLRICAHSIVLSAQRNSGIQSPVTNSHELVCLFLWRRGKSSTAFYFIVSPSVFWFSFFKLSTVSVNGQLESLYFCTSNKLRHISITAGPARCKLGAEHSLGDKCSYLEITRKCNIYYFSFHFVFSPGYFLAFSPTGVYIYRLIFERGYKVGNFSC